jgi:membrane protein implicated in regulation of membrane protease activity
MDAWIWLLGGIGLIVIEVMIPSGFFLLLLGLAALLVGTLVWLGIVGSWGSEVILFGIAAVILWSTLAEKLARSFSRRGVKSPQGQLEGAVVVVDGEIAAGARGLGTLWGSSWRLHNIDSVTLPAGSEAVVVASEGIGLQVKRK